MNSTVRISNGAGDVLERRRCASLPRWSGRGERNLPPKPLDFRHVPRGIRLRFDRVYSYNGSAIIQLPAARFFISRNSFNACTTRR